MNKTDKKHLLSRLAQVKGTEHLAQITTEMSKRMWTMKKTHSTEEDSPIWKLFPGTAALWEALQITSTCLTLQNRVEGPVAGWTNSTTPQTSAGNANVAKQPYAKATYARRLDVLGVKKHAAYAMSPRTTSQTAKENARRTPPPR
jgi:hypothetical protein